VRSSPWGQADKLYAAMRGPSDPAGGRIEEGNDSGVTFEDFKASLVIRKRERKREREMEGGKGREGKGTALRRPRRTSISKSEGREEDNDSTSFMI
jgi:hypothetical protein